MKISALKKRVNMSNNSEIIKLYKKHENYVLISVEKLRQNIFKSICHTVNLLKILGNFANELKVVNITPLFRKEDPLDKTNHRPIIILPTVSKIFEIILFSQLQRFSNKFLSPLLCGFRKGYSTQYVLINLLQKWQKCLHASDRIV